MVWLYAAVVDPFGRVDGLTVIGGQVGVGVGVGVGLGVGVGVANGLGPWMATVIGDPVLKKPTVEFTAWGALLASKRKLYRVPQRTAFAFWLVAKVSVAQVSEPEAWVEVHGVLLNPVFPTVLSLAHPGS